MIVVRKSHSLLRVTRMPVASPRGHWTYSEWLWLVVATFAVAYTTLISGFLVYPAWVAVLGICAYGVCVVAYRGGREQTLACFHAYCAGLTAIAISRTFAVFWNDQIQNGSDADSFFEAAAFVLRETSVDDVRMIINGWGAVKVWSLVYYLNTFVSSEQTPLVGVLLNSSLFALAASLFVDTACAVGRTVCVNIRRARALFVWCFVFWIFASFHLRDVMTVLLCLVAIRIWVSCYDKISLAKAAVAACALVAIFVAIGTIREESSSIIVVACIVGFASLATRAGGMGGILLAFVGVALAMIAYQAIYAKLLGVANVLRFYQEGYQYEASAGSLGHRLIVGQSLPIRAILGFVYLHIFPIPVWSGFLLDSSYYWFKSAQVCYMAIVIPYAIAGAKRMFMNRRARVSLVFLTALYVAITGAVGISSLETRHYAQVLPCLMLVAAVEHHPRERRRYQNYIVLFLCLIHLAWMFLKAI